MTYTPRPSGTPLQRGFKPARTKSPLERGGAKRRGVSFLVMCIGAAVRLVAGLRIKNEMQTSENRRSLNLPEVLMLLRTRLVEELNRQRAGERRFLPRA